METGMINDFKDATDQSSEHDQDSTSTVAAMIAWNLII